MIDTSLSFSGLQIMTHSNRSRSRHPAFKLVEWGSEMILIGREFSRLPGRLSGQHRSLMRMKAMPVFVLRPFDVDLDGIVATHVGKEANTHLELAPCRSLR